MDQRSTPKWSSLRDWGYDDGCGLRRRPARHIPPRRHWDATKGFPGEGPPRRARSQTPARRTRSATPSRHRTPDPERRPRKPRGNSRPCNLSDRRRVRAGDAENHWTMCDVPFPVNSETAVCLVCSQRICTACHTACRQDGRQLLCPTKEWPERGSFVVNPAVTKAQCKWHQHESAATNTAPLLSAIAEEVKPPPPMPLIEVHNTLNFPAAPGGMVLADFMPKQSAADTAATIPTEFEQQIAAEAARREQLMITSLAKVCSRPALPTASKFPSRKCRDSRHWLSRPCRNSLPSMPKRAPTDPPTTPSLVDRKSMQAGGFGHCPHFFAARCRPAKPRCI